jgi:hypothetical protein
MNFKPVVAIAIASATLLAGCDGKNESTQPKRHDPNVHTPPAPVKPPTPVSPRDAMKRIIFGASGETALTIEGQTIRYDGFQTIELLGVTALVAGGTVEGASHADSGELGVWYFSKSGGGYKVAGKWPDLLASGSFGDAPEWRVRHDFGSSPVLLVTGGGTWLGETCEWTGMVELAKSRPVILHDGILIHHDNEPSEDGEGRGAENYDGRIAPLPGGRIAVEYKGKPAGRVIYELKGNAYRPVRGQSERSGC